MLSAIESRCVRIARARMKAQLPQSNLGDLPVDLRRLESPKLALDCWILRLDTQTWIWIIKNMRLSVALFNIYDMYKMTPIKIQLTDVN